MQRQGWERSAHVYIRVTAASVFEANIARRFLFDQVESKGGKGCLLGFLSVEYPPGYGRGCRLVSKTSFATGGDKLPDIYIMMPFFGLQN